MKPTHALAIFAFTAASIMIAAPGVGQPQNCAPRDSVLTRLSNDYGETRRSVAMGQNETVVEVFASDTTGSWSITVTLPNGLTCLVASGQAYEAVQTAPKPNV